MDAHCRRVPFGKWMTTERPTMDVTPWSMSALSEYAAVTGVTVSTDVRTPCLPERSPTSHVVGTDALQT